MEGRVRGSREVRISKVRVQSMVMMFAENAIKFARWEPIDETQISCISLSRTRPNLSRHTSHLCDLPGGRFIDLGKPYYRYPFRSKLTLVSAQRQSYPCHSVPSYMSCECPVRNKPIPMLSAQHVEHQSYPCHSYRDVSSDMRFRHSFQILSGISQRLSPKLKKPHRFSVWWCRASEHDCDLQHISLSFRPPHGSLETHGGLFKSSIYLVWRVCFFCYHSFACLTL